MAITKHQVRFNFSGSIIMEVTGDPEADNWTNALSRAWAELAVGELSEAADLDGAEIEEEVGQWK